MKLMNLFKPTTLVTVGIPVSIMAYWQANLPIAIGAGVITTASILTAWLNSEPKSTVIHPQLPKRAIKQLGNSLHHSQIPLFEQVIQPVMAAEFGAFQAIIKGKKINDEPITLFDTKIEILTTAFAKLKGHGSLYQKRIHDDRDRAVTLLVFLALFFSEESSEVKLQSVLKKLPSQAFKLLRKEAYRLFDLTYLLIEQRLVINTDMVNVFTDSSLFNRYSLSSASPSYLSIDKSTPTLLSSLPTTMDKPEPNASSPENTVPQEPIDKVVVKDDSIVTEESCQPVVAETNLPLKPDCTKIENPSIIPDFISWLEKRISSANRQFAIESQKLVVSNPDKYSKTQVFVLPDVLGKYQSRSGIEVGVLKKTLHEASSIKNSVSVKRDEQSIDVTPCTLSIAFESNALSEIEEGELLCEQL